MSTSANLLETASLFESMEEAFLSIIIDAACRMAHYTGIKVFALLDAGPKGRKIAGHEDLKSAFQTHRLFPAETDLELDSLQDPPLIENGIVLPSTYSSPVAGPYTNFFPKSRTATSVRGRKRLLEGWPRPASNKFPRVSPTMSEESAHLSLKDENDVEIILDEDYGIDSVENSNAVSHPRPVNHVLSINESRPDDEDAFFPGWSLSAFLCGSPKAAAILQTGRSFTPTKGSTSMRILHSLVWDIAKEVEPFWPEDRPGRTSTANHVFDRLWSYFPEFEIEEIREARIQVGKQRYKFKAYLKHCVCNTIKNKVKRRMKCSASLPKSNDWSDGDLGEYWEVNLVNEGTKGSGVKKCEEIWI